MTARGWIRCHCGFSHPAERGYCAVPSPFVTLDDDVPAAFAGGAGELKIVDILTPRELEIVLLMVGAKKTRTEIAEQLGISPKTFDSHRGALMRKLGIATSIELALRAVREGLVDA